MYNRYLKRIFDFVLSLIALVILSPVLLILTIVGALKMRGNPFFLQLRPGKDEKIFKIIKFRTMTCQKDKTGKLLSDDLRLTRYGKMLRSTSLDELPELINILIGDMSFVGPRPQLVRDMVFMSARDRLRHTVRPGLSGLAQINGRNNMSWEKKFEYDLKYIENITAWEDLKIIFLTFFKVLKRDGICEQGMATAADLGDYMLQKGEVDIAEYNAKQLEAKELMKV